MPKPTLKSLAAELQVDVSLVSRVLRRVPGVRVSEAKRARILALAERAGYRPDRLGRSLKTGHSRIVAMLTPDITNPFHSLIFRGAEHVAQQAGYNVILMHLSDVDESGADAVTPLTEGQCDGVLIAAGRADDDRFAPLRRAHLPHVVINRPIDGGRDTPCFAPDDRETGRLGARLLLQAGHARVAAILGDMRLANMQARLEGFREIVDAAGPRVETTVVADVRSREEVLAAFDRLIGLPADRRPTALFVPHSIHAQLVFEASLLREIHIPQQLSLLGYGGVAPPALSAIVVSAEQMGRDAMRYLLARIQAPGDAAAAQTDLGAYPLTFSPGCTLRPPAEA